MAVSREVAAGDTATAVQYNNTIWDIILDIGDFDTVLDGGSTATNTIFERNLISSTTNEDAILQTTNVSSETYFYPTYTNVLEFVAYFDGTTNQDAWMGLASLTGAFASTVPVNSTATTAHAAFCVEDGTLKSSTASGTTQTTNTITGITLGAFNTFKIVMSGNPISSVKFYVNHVEKFDHTTNLPYVSDIGHLFFGIRSATAATHLIKIPRTLRMKTSRIL